MKRHLLVLAALFFWFGGIIAQTNFIRQDSVYARTSDCTLGVAVCIDSIAYDNINDLRFFVDGQQFSTQFTPCLVNTVHNYSYSDIFRGGEQGPWRLDSWTVNGQTYSGTFNNLQMLLDSMRRWNPSGNWQLEPSARIIYGYVAASTTYSCQEIFGTARGGQSQVCYNSGIEYRGLRFNVPVGVHQLIVEKVRTGERDTVTLLAACLKPETVRRTVRVGDNALYCASLTDLLGTLKTTKNICPRPANAITFGTPQTTCLRYTGTSVGTDSACIEICDRYGFCDTTYLIVTAATATGSNLSFNDTISTGLRRTTCEVVLPTGTITSFTNTCAQNSGTNVSFELDLGTNCVTYRGLTVGTDTACLKACNTEGVCATTTVTITTIPYVTPVAPTRFVYSDTITVGLTRNKCSFNAPAGAITIFQNICPTNSGTNVGFTLDQASKCVSYRGILIGRDTACIRVCNAALVCDTTYMYIAAIVNGNGGGTNNGTGRRITVRDTISIGGSRENCGVSVPATVLSITNLCPQGSGTHVAFSIDTVRRCVTYRGLTVGVDSACYLVCNPNGVCDTTVYIVGTVDTTNRGKTITIRDTISVGLTRRDCRVSIPRGTFSYITNNCPANSSRNVSFVYNDGTRCTSYSGLLVGADTACIVVCNTANVCDTTIFIITAIENTSGGGNRCGLQVTPVVQVRSCSVTGFITLATSGSTGPYTYKWADLSGTNQPQNRTGLEAGTYRVTVSPNAPNCDTTLTITVANNATNCGGIGANRCGLAVIPAAVSKTCTANGAISLAVAGSTAPYTFNWADLAGTNDPQNRTNLEAGIYSVTVTPSAPNCDTVIAVVVANNATNCSNGSNIRLATVDVVTQDSTIFCVDSSRVLGGFTIVLTASQVFSTIAPATPLGCYKVKGFVVGQDSALIILIGTNGVRDTTKLTINVTPRLTNACGLVVLPTATPKTCVANGTIALAVSGSTAPYYFDWADVTGTNDPQNRTNLQAGTYTVKVKSTTPNCDTTLSIIVANNCVANTCGLLVTPTATPKTCTSNGSITLVVTGSSAPYTFDWSDLAGTIDPQNRTNLPAGTYTVKVTPSVLGCDTTLSVVVANNATNCGAGNTCGLVVSSTAVPKTCNARGSITLTVSGGTAPYSYNWADLNGASFPQNRTNLNEGIYAVTISSATPNCDTTLRITVANDSTNCTNSRSRLDSITVFVQDSATYCIDSSRVLGGFSVFISSPQLFSIIDRSVPVGCFKVKGFVVGRDTALIILTGQNGFRDTLRLITKVVSRGVTPTLGVRPDTIRIKILETRTYCPDRSRLAGSPITLVKFCSTDPFDNTTNVRLDTVNKCVIVTGASTGVDTFCVLLQNAAGFTDTTKLFVFVTRDTVTPQYRTDTVRLFVGDSLTYCNIDTGMIRGIVDTIYNQCASGSGRFASVQITPAKCLTIKGLAVGTDSACIVVLNRLVNLRDTTKVIIIVTQRPTTGTTRRADSIIVQVGESRTYCPDTSRLRGARVTLLGSCSNATVDNSVIFLVNSTKCVDIDGLSVGRDTVCLQVCNVNNVCDTTILTIIVVPERPLASSTVVVPIQLNKDLIFCGVDTSQIRGRVDRAFDACPAKNGSKARMVIDQVTHCVKITGVNVGRDTMCVVVCNTQSRICDTTFIIAVVTDTAGGRIIVIANDDFDSLRRGTNKTLELYNNDTLRPRRPTSLTIITPPTKGTADTISFANGLVKYTAGRTPLSCGLDSFRYRVCIDSICDTALVVVLVVCPDSLQVWKALSPNGDGRNDVFLVEGLQNYPNHTVYIFNRWGNEVLKQKDYQNDWQGTWNGVNLPDGTYFYFIRNDDNGEMILTGYVQLVR